MLESIEIDCTTDLKIFIQDFYSNFKFYKFFCSAHFFNPVWFAKNWEFMIGPCVGAVFAGVLFAGFLVSKKDGRRLSVISNFR